MNIGKTLFAQIMEFVPWTSFSRIVQRYSGDSGVRRLTCAEQCHLPHSISIPMGALVALQALDTFLPF